MLKGTGSTDGYQEVIQRDPLTGFPTQADPLLASSFRNFMWRTWKSLGFPPPTDLHYDMADYLQYGAGGRGDQPFNTLATDQRLILMAFRGAAKSYVTVTFSLWTLYRNPDLQVLVTSATGGYAKDNAAFAFKMLNTFDWLAWMKPHSSERQSALSFDIHDCNVAKDSSFTCVGIEGQLTGRRADLVIPDDVETPNTSATENARIELGKRIGEFAAIKKPGGSIIYLGTAQHEETIYLKLEQERGFTLRMWPAHYPKPAELIRYGHRLGPMILKDLASNPNLAGCSTEPGRFDEADLAGRELEWGRTEYARQYRLFLDAGLSDDKPLKLRDLVVIDLTPNSGVPAVVQWSTLKQYRMETAETGIDVDSLPSDPYVHAPAHVEAWGPCSSIRCFVDPSGEGADETVWTIVGERFGLLYLLWQGSSRKGFSDEVLWEIVNDCALWSVSELEVEENFGQGMFAALLRPKFREWKKPGLGHNGGPALEGYKCSVIETHTGKQAKELRIVSSLEPIISGHRLVVNAQVLRRDFHIPYEDLEDAKRRFYRLSYQLTRLTKTKGALVHDDRIDSLAGACKGHLLAMEQSTVDAGAKARDAALEAEIEKIVEARRKQGLPLFGLEKLEGTLPGQQGGGRGMSKLFGMGMQRFRMRGKR